MIIKLAPDDIKRYNWYIWKTVIGCFAFFVLLLIVTYLGLFGPLPPFRDLENPKSNQASEVLSTDKTVLGTYYVQNRSSVNFSQLSPNVVNALIATEDTRFYRHSGIDFQRIPSMLLYNLVGSKQGASTITQQLAKNLFSGQVARNPFVRFTQKLKEWIISIQLERRYTKQEILAMYLNTVSFGSYNTYGIKSAAHTYFNVAPDKLTPDQAALLVGMLKGTSYYSPIRHPDRALGRRNLILSKMAKQEFLSDGQLEELKKKPLGLNFSPMNHNDGPAPYFRAVLKQQIQKIFKDQNIVRSDGSTYDLDRDGLKIYTTIDATMQKYAEDAQRAYMPALQAQFNEQWKGVSRWKTIKNFKLLLDKGMMLSDRYKQLQLEGRSDEEIRQNFETPDSLELFTWRGNIDTVMKPIDSIVYTKMMLRNAMMSMDPTTGYIRAWVGGTDFEHVKYDQVTGTRQVGSTAKPFTYAVAMQLGFSPCMEVDNVPDTIEYDGQRWCPRSGKAETIQGTLTLREALAHSQNWITAHVMKEVKPLPVVELTKKMGVTSEVPPYPSICIGSFNASVFDMTGAYSVFANHGTWTEPTFILRIEDRNGNVIYTHTPKVVQAMDEQTAYVMTYMLKGVVDIQGATGNRLRWKYNFTNPIGGKTGTTNDNSDGWFIGVTPQLVTGVWTGCEDRDIHFRSERLGEGANTALPIFALYMKKVYANPTLGIKKNVDFDAPKNGVNTVLDCNTYRQQQPGTGEVEKKLGF